MNKKITARLSLASGSLDPVNDVIGIVDISAGPEGDKKITPNALFTGWGITPAGEALVKSPTLASQKTLLGVDNFIYNPAIIGLTGSGPTKLDGVPTVGLAVGTMVMVHADNITLGIYKLEAGGGIESLPTTVIPDDYNSSTNSKHWTNQYFIAETLFAKQSVETGMVVIGDAIKGSLIAPVDHASQVKLPSINGTLSVDLDVITYDLGITTDSFIDVVQMRNQYIEIITPPGSGFLNINFPIQQYRKGQIIILVSRFDLPVSLNLEPMDSTFYSKDTLVSLLANMEYKFIVINPAPLEVRLLTDVPV